MEINTSGKDWLIKKWKNWNKTTFEWLFILQWDDIHINFTKKPRLVIFSVKLLDSKQVDIHLGPALSLGQNVPYRVFDVPQWGNIQEEKQKFPRKWSNRHITWTKGRAIQVPDFKAIYKKLSFRYVMLGYHQKP